MFGADPMRLALGTAQFGLDYGVSNAAGRVPPAEIESILALAADAGIDLLDTAAAYGQAERSLGRFAADPRWRIVTKLAPIESDDPAQAARAARDSLERSLGRLGRTRLYAVLWHQTIEAFSSATDAVFAELDRMRAEGLVEKVGASLYDRNEIEGFLNRYPLDLVQVPVNILDQRLSGDGFLKSLADRRLEIHARSAFLQGLLLMPSEKRPAYFDAFGSPLARFDQWAASRTGGPLQACLAFMRQRRELARVVVGVCSAGELTQVIEAWTAVEGRQDDFSDLACGDVGLVNPALWPAWIR